MIVDGLVELELQTKPNHEPDGSFTGGSVRAYTSSNPLDRNVVPKIAADRNFAKFMRHLLTRSPIPPAPV